MKNKGLVVLIEVALFSVIAIILDLLPSFKPAPNISISFAMLPVFIISLRRGFKAGCLTGFMWGILQVITGDIYFLSIIQFLIEYFIAFTFAGFAGTFYSIVQSYLKNGKNVKLSIWLVVAVMVGSVARYFWHFVAGVAFWSSSAPKGMSPYWYSFTVNGTAMIGSAISCAIILVVLINTAPNLLLPKQSNKLIVSETK